MTDLDEIIASRLDAALEPLRQRLERLEETGIRAPGGDGGGGDWTELEESISELDQRLSDVQAIALHALRPGAVLVRDGEVTLRDADAGVLQNAWNGNTFLLVAGVQVGTRIPISNTGDQHLILRGAPGVEVRAVQRGIPSVKSDRARVSPYDWVVVEKMTGTAWHAYGAVP